jgi:hypothetical protein
LLFWFAVGAVLALAVLTGYAGVNWTSLLRVGSTNPLLDRIEGDLGAVLPRDPIGHDGQIYYMIARDPLGRRGTPDAIGTLDPNGPRYRYRRILLPLLAGGFGQFGGWATLSATVLILSFSMGLMAVAIADLCFLLHLRDVAVLPAIVNVGALMSLLFLTADVLALALALGGCVLVLRGRTGWSIAALALAALAKEVYIVVAWSIAAWMRQSRDPRTAAATAVLPALPVLAWSAWLWTAFSPAQGNFSNLGVPLVGILEATPLWLRESNPVEIFLIASTLTAFLVGALMVVMGRSALLRWLIVPWLALGCLGTVAVWGRPNNAARAFAIVWPLSVLLLSDRLLTARGSRGRSPLA